MKIAAVEVFAFRYEVAGGPFAMSDDRIVTEQDSTIVKLTTDDGTVGWGEQCSFSPAYLPGHAEGVRAAMTVLGPAVIGCDPRRVEAVHARLDKVMKGHEYAKSALDIACWDAFGKAVGMRVGDLLGGLLREEVSVYKAVGLADPEAMARRCAQLCDEGYRVIQVKVGGSREDDLRRFELCAAFRPRLDRMIFDANGHWSQHEAIAMAPWLRGLDVYLEQPCQSTLECAEVRRRLDSPLILDESLANLSDLLEASRASALDGARLKLSRFGGITPIRRARDLAAALGLSMTIEDSAGGDIVSAATTHLAASTPAKHLLEGFVPSGEVVEHIAAVGFVVHDGQVTVPQGDGLGISVDEAALGAPVARYA